MEIQGTYTDHSHDTNVEKYYRFHSRIYDATRWSFLFGRDQLLDMIPVLPSQPRILEVGCGTGKNLDRLQYHFPDAHLVGVDLSPAMLNIARNKLSDTKQVELVQAKYGSEELNLEPFDLILFSYSLTMFADGIEDIMAQVSKDLNKRGYVAVVDFNTSPYKWFRQWMGMNHVDLNGHILPLLNKYYRPVETQKDDAYLGLWSYFKFIGQYT
ncbi:class I SAM-dependent methyltransferase [Fodinibius halophilus]|uniref:Methyltransferase domain-containing protein n=1 Tax=Fodinibius halophilus TaxID=1736908 RepID=A0A6M1TDM6_9BACT|nr:methyltransferase domain-containing protein [Fodinibius halophilus]NGP88924.1 methyltransferase domain-containing protein [Fodinibius halophilus]